MKKLSYILLALVLGLLASTFAYFENNSLVETNLQLCSHTLPASFNGYKIVQISDLHNIRFGEHQSAILARIRAANADIIVVTGDLVYDRPYGEAEGLEFMRRAVRIAPVYFITGNHEWQSDRFYSLEPKLRAAGIHVLHDEHAVIRRGAEYIILAGLDDITKGTHKGDQLFADDYHEAILSTKLDRALAGTSPNTFTILLSHQPQFFSVYARHGIDLTFCGHAHGGQIRLPFIGGLYAPGQGLFPKYTTGMYRLAKSSMVVSRGLGNSIFKLRVFDRPEIVALTLESQQR
ncbi:MAG TPA: metallophosphoesterase [Candidatus Aquicultor sp.]|jgi:hypothetical protein